MTGRRRGRPRQAADGHTRVVVRIMFDRSLLDASDVAAEMWTDGNLSALVRMALEQSLKRWATEPPVSDGGGFVQDDPSNPRKTQENGHSGQRTGR